MLSACDRKLQLKLSGRQLYLVFRVFPRYLLHSFSFKTLAPRKNHFCGPSQLVLTSHWCLVEDGIVFYETHIMMK